MPDFTKTYASAMAYDLLVWRRWSGLPKLKKGRVKDYAIIEIRHCALSKQTNKQTNEVWSSVNDHRVSTFSGMSGKSGDARNLGNFSKC